MILLTKAYASLEAHVCCSRWEQKLHPQLLPRAEATNGKTKLPSSFLHASTSSPALLAQFCLGEEEEKDDGGGGRERRWRRITSMSEYHCFLFFLFYLPLKFIRCSIGIVSVLTSIYWAVAAPTCTYRSKHRLIPCLGPFFANIVYE